MYLCVLCGSQNEQPLFTHLACSLQSVARTCFPCQITGYHLAACRPTFEDNAHTLSLEYVIMCVTLLRVSVCLQVNVRRCRQAAGRVKAIEKEKLSLHLPVSQCHWHGPVQPRVLVCSKRRVFLFCCRFIKDSTQIELRAVCRACQFILF